MKASPLYLTWLNNLGGFEYFLFIAFKEFDIDVVESATVKRNILPTWPKSYGSNADTIEKQTYRKTKKSILIRSQNVSLNQVNALAMIKTSTLVQIMTTRNDRVTILVDTDTFKIYDERDKIFSITFKATLTNELPSQKI